ncbi:chromosomal replication initiator protein DnaA [Sinanaerobacter chloroacetimidivorans]|jgi:chromosomal replication initiator protein|uniref:Chromosomal replication initiator protein DnaA n=1 Tax=Sinanaerobacter chloroacetimidivorans TaxID=2818044 RepID=A0A8J8B257_9FIRM|nr:chromosomal replication initiator protein DnaA [Sinanaerobacter chloroacetimidivorans]MBR0598421.1 chromosomal replication initiator protein DnaA [Sinanaerobacter chloroacetimidivorans]
MNNLTENWEKTLELLKPELTAVSYDTWVYPLTPVKVDYKENKLYLSLYNDMAKSILEGRYISIIENAVKEAFGQKLKVFFVYPEETQDQQEEINFTDELYLNPKYIFNTFVIGNNNRFAHAASLAVAESPSKAYNPLFIYGGAGLGKTHLMHAIGHYILQQNPRTKVLYVSSEMFTNELIKAIREDKNVEFRNKYRSIDVLLIDDIQFIEKKERTQEEIFHTFNTLYEANKQIIISSDRPPKEIQTLEERLRSRFEWGLIADIQPPDYETRVAILRNKAELEGLETTDSLIEVIGVIAEKIQSNIRELEGAFIRVIAYANLTNQKINRDLAKEVLKDVFSSKDRQVTPALVKKYICKHFNIKQADLESAKRSRNLAFPRQIAMYICRDMTDLSLPKIGEFFGNRDHTTVLHACDKISSEMKTNESLREVIKELENSIKED